MRLACLFLLSIWLALPAWATTRYVSPNCTGVPSPCYTNFSTNASSTLNVQANDAANDSIVILPGEWDQDWYTINVNNLRVTCVDANWRFPDDPLYNTAQRPVFDGLGAADPGRFGMWHSSGAVNRFSMNGGEFRNIDSPDDNGSAIRAQAATTGLWSYRNMYVHHAEIDIQAVPVDSVIIENCVLGTTIVGGAGGGTPFNHNIYIDGPVHYFRVQGCNIYGAWGGHNVKSRAERTYVLYNKLFDGGDLSRYPSSNVDIPNEGLAFVIGNVMEQDNNPNVDVTMIGYGRESTSNSGISQHLWVMSNTVVNKLVGSGVFIRNGTDAGLVTTYKNNILYGDGSVTSGSGTFTGTNNYRETGSGNNVKFASPAGGDYRLTAATPGGSGNALDQATANGTNDGFDCTPTLQYVYPSSSTTTGGTTTRTTSGSAADIGAFEFSQSGGGGGGGGTDPCTPFMWWEK